MKRFACECGAPVFFANSFCLNCNSTLGYAPRLGRMLALQEAQPSLWQQSGQHATPAKQYRLCRNRIDYEICNWLVDADSSHAYCLSCRLNNLIPNLAAEPNLKRWAIMETNKRHLLYSLIGLGLPVVPRAEQSDGLSFAFMEDKRSNPDVGAEHVYTGHANGLITINLLEADELSREQQRLWIGESYRTLLGHFRHESGHYYFDRLLRDTPQIEEFRQLFGDERIDYQSALAAYHDNLAQIAPSDQFISIYAQSHPFEDWAESWAHYLHINDVLETAVGHGMLAAEVLRQDFHQRIITWIDFAVGFNALNRSLGLNDAYPFFVTPMVTKKLAFIDRLITRTHMAQEPEQ